MKKVTWNQREIEKVCRHYCDKTGIQDWQPHDVVMWAKKEGWEMPTPPTGEEILARLLSSAAMAARRKDSKTSVLYRANLVIRKMVKGEWRSLWFDADGPTVTEERVLASCRSRKDKALNILASASATAEHFYSTHPEIQRSENLDFGITDQEVQWRLFGPRREQDDTEQKTG